jgi:putative intracellular protease/amidase
MQLALKSDCPDADEHMKEVLESTPMSEVKAEDFDAIFLPGGLRGSVCASVECV